jgi:hypothetical protein
MKFSVVGGTSWEITNPDNGLCTPLAGGNNTKLPQAIAAGLPIWTGSGPPIYEAVVLPFGNLLCVQHIIGTADKLAQDLATVYRNALATAAT